jgi:hypothetical protein
VRVPQVRDAEVAYRSNLIEYLAGNTEALALLIVEMYAPGRSIRDIEDAFRGPDGELLISRNAVSEITDRLWEDYQAFCTRDLSEIDVAYLFVTRSSSPFGATAPRRRGGARRRTKVIPRFTDERSGMKLVFAADPVLKAGAGCRSPTSNATNCGCRATSSRSIRPGRRKQRRIARGKGRPHDLGCFIYRSLRT